MDEAEFERESLRRAQAGDAEARREALGLGVDALRRGLILSADLRVFLADGLMAVQQAVDPGPGESVTPDDALAFFGYRPPPPNRPRTDDSEKMRRAVEIAAAVYVLAPHAGNTTAAVRLVAESACCTVSAVWAAWRDGRMSDWAPWCPLPAYIAPDAPYWAQASSYTPEGWAHGLLFRAAEVVRRTHGDETARCLPQTYSKEVRDFLRVKK